MDAHKADAQTDALCTLVGEQPFMHCRKTFELPLCKSTLDELARITEDRTGRMISSVVVLNGVAPLVLSPLPPLIRLLIGGHKKSANSDSVIIKNNWITACDAVEFYCNVIQTCAFLPRKSSLMPDPELTKLVVENMNAIQKSMVDGWNVGRDNADPLWADFHRALSEPSDTIPGAVIRVGAAMATGVFTHYTMYTLNLLEQTLWGIMCARAPESRRETLKTCDLVRTCVECVQSLGKISDADHRVREYWLEHQRAVMVSTLKHEWITNVVSLPDGPTCVMPIAAGCYAALAFYWFALSLHTLDTAIAARAAVGDGGGDPPGEQ